MAVVTAAALTALTVAAVPVPTGLASTHQVGGGGRYVTAVDVAKQLGGGLLSGLDRIIVVSGESFPDALVASGLAGFLDDGGRSGRTAILLTEAGRLPPVVEDAVQVSGVPVDRVLVVGDAAAVAEEVRAAVAVAAGWNGVGVNPVIRIGGEDRYATAAAVVDYVRKAAGTGLPESYRTVLVASGEQFPDALVAGAFAYRNGHLLLLSRQSHAPRVTLDAVGELLANCAVMVGGTAVLASQVETQVEYALVRSSSGCGVERIAGRDRYDTAARVATRFVALNGAPREAFVASGTSFVEVLTAGPLAGGNGPLLLTTANRLSDAALVWLLQHRAGIDEVRMIGGADTVNPAVGNQAKDAVALPQPPVLGPAPVPVVTAPSSPATCAEGGDCAVGEVGPGGGLVFYAPGAPFTVTGSACNTSCRYLEAAPQSGEVVRSWATDVNNNRTTQVSGAMATGIGSGRENSQAIVAQDGNVAASSAAVYAWDYTTVVADLAYSDWFLPSRDELNELCKFAREQTTGDTTVACDGSGSLRESFVDGGYWSSSQFSAVNPWLQFFFDGEQDNVAGKGFVARVRPVRVF